MPDKLRVNSHIMDQNSNEMKLQKNNKYTPFKSKSISGLLKESSEITIRPTTPTSPLKSMESPSHSISACKSEHNKAGAKNLRQA